MVHCKSNPWVKSLKLWEFSKTNLLKTYSGLTLVIAENLVAIALVVITMKDRWTKKTFDVLYYNNYDNCKKC